MDITVTDSSSINPYAVNEKTSGSKSANRPKSLFVDVLYKYLPKEGATITDEIKTVSRDRRVLLNQLIESMRLESEARRNELLSRLAQKDDEELPLDVYSKCLKIAMKIMRGEKVSVQEMQFLAQNAPELLFMALIMRVEDNDRDENDSLPEDYDRLLNSYSCESPNSSVRNADPGLEKILT